LVVPFDSKLREFTLVREFNVATGQMMHGTVAGMFEQEKHASPLQCAQFELEEEAQLTGGHWIPLLSKNDDCSDAGSVVLSKYLSQSFWPYLVTDPAGPVADPRPVDDDEFIEVVRGVALDQVHDMIQHGNIAVVHAYALLLAIDKLRALELV